VHSGIDPTPDIAAHRKESPVLRLFLRGQVLDYTAPNSNVLHVLLFNSPIMGLERIRHAQVFLSQEKTVVLYQDTSTSKNFSSWK
jgi:hypothetical protein